MRISIPLAAGLAALLPTAAWAQAEQIRVRPRIWTADWSGKTMAGTGGSAVDVEDDLGIGRDRGEWVEVMLSQGGGRTWISLWQANPKEDVILATGETINGTFFPATTAVEGSIDIQYTRLLHERFLLGQQIMGFAVIVSFMSGFEYMDIEWKMDDGSTSAKAGMSYYRPLLGFRAEAWISRWLTLEAQILSFFKWKFENIRARTLEGQIGASIRIERWSIDVGWRFTNFEAVEDKSSGNVEMDIDIQGLYLGIGVSF
jgi:opacity protein-like surface antigen